MSLHFLAHPWELRDVGDGILVTLTPRDLRALTVPVMVDELYDLVLENGLANLYLDFAEVQCVTSMTIGKLLSLDGRLRAIGGRLILTNVDPSVHQLFEAANLVGIFDIRLKALQTA
jgi:anti-anti-sigma factor